MSFMVPRTITLSIHSQSSVCLGHLVRAPGAVGDVDERVDAVGGARGADKVAEAKTEDWEWMFEVNVLGTMKLTRAFLPMLRASGEGTVLNLTSTAGLLRL